MAENYTHETFLSPFTWRYGSGEMRKIWSLAHKRRLWRRIWVALAEVQSTVGLVTQAQVEDLRSQQDNIDLERAHQLEAELRHDLMAEVHTYAEQCSIGGGIIHLGATSMDIEDNADTLRLRESLAIVEAKLHDLLLNLADLIEQEANHVCMAYTHLQPAEPTTIGYRLAFTAQDLLDDHREIHRIKEAIQGKGFKGAVGTSASYQQLLSDKDLTPREFEAQIMGKLNLPSYEIAHQTYPRRQDWHVVNALAGLAMTLYKFAFDLRLLQSPPFGEWAEPFGKHQIGSSAMPFKRNPINTENMDSLARFVASLPRVAWDNSAHSLLERTLDDSANRRAVLPEAFLATDELLKRMSRMVKGLQIREEGIERNLSIYGIFAATERLLMEAVRQGGDRQALHEVIRQHSMTAWSAIQQGNQNPLADLLAGDESFLEVLDVDSIRRYLSVADYVGDAPERAQNLAKIIREELN